MLLGTVSCSPNPPIAHPVSSRGPFGETLPPLPQQQELKVNLNIEPSPLPDPLHVGRPVVVRVEAVLVKSGTRCYSCRVNWYADRPSIAAWSRFSDFEGVRVATLEPAAVGDVTLTIEVCPGLDFKCQRQVIKRRVTR
jgi:hypothetical protein